MDLTITVAILCFVSLVAGVQATGYDGVKGFYRDTRQMNGKCAKYGDKCRYDFDCCSPDVCNGRRCGNAEAEVNVNAQKILKALKINRDTRSCGRSGDKCTRPRDCCPSYTCSRGNKCQMVEAEDIVNAQKIQNALKINRDTRQANRKCGKEGHKWQCPSDYYCCPGWLQQKGRKEGSCCKFVKKGF